MWALSIFYLNDIHTMLSVMAGMLFKSNGKLFCRLSIFSVRSVTIIM